METLCCNGAEFSCMELDQLISIQFRNEESDFFRILWRTRRKPLFVTLALICLVMGSFSFYASLATPINPGNDGRWVIYATSIFVPIFAALVMYFALRNYSKKAAASADLVTIEFDAEGVVIDGPKASSTSSWSAFEKVVETPDDFVFYVQPKIFFGVPKRYFDNEGQVQRVRNFISNGVRK